MNCNVKIGRTGLMTNAKNIYEIWLTVEKAIILLTSLTLIALYKLYKRVNTADNR